MLTAVCSPRSCSQRVSSKIICCCLLWKYFSLFSVVWNLHQVWLVYYYVTLALRENILKVWWNFDSIMSFLLWSSHRFRPTVRQLSSGGSITTISRLKFLFFDSFFFFSILFHFNQCRWLWSSFCCFGLPPTWFCTKNLCSISGWRKVAWCKSLLVSFRSRLFKKIFQLLFQRYLQNSYQKRRTYVRRSLGKAQQFDVDSTETLVEKPTDLKLLIPINYLLWVLFRWYLFLRLLWCWSVTLNLGISGSFIWATSCLQLQRAGRCLWQPRVLAC